MLILLLVSGCAVGPDYVPPDPGAPAAWAAADKDGVDGVATAASDLATLAAWWTTLGDPALTDLIKRAVRDNLDLEAARARLREVRAQRGSAGAARFPMVQASASASRSRSGAGAATTIGGLYRAGFDASWEADLFGGRRRDIEAATADVEAGQADLEAVRVSLVAEVAVNYVELRAFQARLAVAEANRQAQKETYELTRWRAEAGLTTQLDVERARAALEQTQAQIPTLQTGLEQAGNHLATLLGRPPGALRDALVAPRPIPAAPAEVAVGVPADALRQRPDVRRAERQLAAQTARVGAATARRYPSLALVGSIGLESLLAGDLFTAAARTASVSGNAGWTLFDAGALKSNVEVQAARRDQALAAYSAAVLAALEEVEGVLLSYAGEQTRRDALVRAATAAERAAALARDQYTSGLIDFQSVLDAERSLLSLQDQLAVSQGAVTTDVIRLYKALGGGWAPLTAEAGTQTDDPELLP